MSSARGHKEQTSEIVGRDGDSELLLRARCSCGWGSEPVRMAEVSAVWVDHFERSTGRKPVG